MSTCGIWRNWSTRLKYQILDGLEVKFYNKGGFMNMFEGKGGRQVILSLIMILMLFMMPACGGGGGGGGTGGGGTTPGQSKYTVMVYIVGSDLESGPSTGKGYATFNIQQMMDASSSDSVNMVLTTGGAKKGGLGIDWTTVSRHVVKNGKLTTVGNVGKKNMADPAALTDFIVWAKTNYPADRYALVLWDHGGGDLYGYGKDENYNDLLSVPEMTQAIKNATQQTGIKFDLIGFDACLMATVEVAHNFAPYGKYLVVSENPEPGKGWDWKTLTNTIVKNPTVDPLTLGITIADSYSSQCTTTESKIATLSVVNLANVPAVVSSLDALSQKISAKLSATNTKVDSFAPVINSRRDSIFAISNSNAMSTDYALVDMMNMYATTKTQPSIASTYPTESAAVVFALKQAVAYNVTGTSVSKSANGLSIFLPRNTDANYAKSIATYSAIDFSANYKSMLGIYAANRSTASVAPPSFGAVSFSKRVFTSNVNNFQNAVNPSILLALTDNPSVLLITGTDLANMNTNTGSISYNYDKIFFFYDNNTIQDLMYSEYLFSNDSLLVYQAPVYVNSQPMYLMFSYDPNSFSSTILGVFKYTDAGTIDKNIQQIQAGDKIMSVYMGYSLAVGFFSVQGTEFTATSSLTVYNGTIPKGYILGGFFMVEDLTGKTYYSSPAVGLGKALAKSSGDSLESDVLLPLLPSNFTMLTPADFFGH